MKSKIIFLNGESILVQQGDCIRSIDASGFTLEEKQLLHHHDGLSVGIAVAISHGKFFQSKPVRFIILPLYFPSKTCRIDMSIAC